MKRIQLLIISSFIFLYSGLIQGKTIVISDIDDTIKLAYTLGGVKGYYQFLKKIPFYEMRDVFNEIKTYEASGVQEQMGELHSNISFFYISAAPKITFDGPEWISKNNFPRGPVVLKTGSNGGPTYSYKYNNMKAIILDQQKRFGDLKILFFGDNSQVDANVYVDLVKNMNLDAEIFIRDVATDAQEISSELKIKRLEGVNYFFSEVELRDFPYFHFLSNDVWEKIVKKYNSKKLVPDYVQETLSKRFESVCQNKIVDLDNLKSELRKCSQESKLKSESFFDSYYARY